jgi:hypothetical protein
MLKDGGSVLISYDKYKDRSKIIDYLTSSSLGLNEWPDIVVLLDVRPEPKQYYYYYYDQPGHISCKSLLHFVKGVKLAAADNYIKDYTKYKKNNKPDSAYKPK